MSIISPLFSETFSFGQANVQAPTISGYQSFTYTGADQSFVVPAGVSSLDVVMRGAGGGGSSRQPAGLFDAASGGAGAYVTGTISVTPGETLRIVVGWSRASIVWRRWFRRQWW
jgi:hypothetical protein